MGDLRMDNFKIEIVSEGRKEFEAALRIAFAHAPGSKATHYAILPDKGMVFYWHEPESNFKAVALPSEIDVEEAVVLAWAWLTKKADYEGEPDHDGDNGKGYRIYNEDWGHVHGSHYAFVAIEPAWAMYGK